MDTFFREVVEQQSTPVVILFPQSAKTLLDYENGTPVNYQEMLPAIQDTAGTHVIDLAPVFIQEKQQQRLEYQDFFTGPEGHYSNLGNQIVARTVLQKLCGWGLLDC